MSTVADLSSVKRAFAKAALCTKRAVKEAACLATKRAEGRRPSGEEEDARRHGTEEHHKYDGYETEKPALCDESPPKRMPERTPVTPWRALGGEKREKAVRPPSPSAIHLGLTFFPAKQSVRVNWIEVREDRDSKQARFCSALRLYSLNLLITGLAGALTPRAGGRVPRPAP